MLAMSVVATTTLDDEWRVLKTSYDNTTTTTNNNSNASTSTSISSEKGSVVGSLSNFAVPFFQDVTIVSSCSAAITSNSDDSLGRMPVNTTANNKVMAPSLLMESHSGGNASTFALRRRATLARMNFRSTKQTLESKYELNPEPIGEGAFGQVFVARDKTTGELVAVKKIWKEYSDNHDFVREMNALLHIQAHGGHPHICQLRENFDEPEHFALVLDLIKGGEVFEHLVQTGAYSELDGTTCPKSRHDMNKGIVWKTARVVSHLVLYCLTVNFLFAFVSESANPRGCFSFGIHAWNWSGTL